MVSVFFVAVQCSRRVAYIIAVSKWCRGVVMSNSTFECRKLLSNYI